MERIEYSKQIADILSQSRYESGLSQDYMASCLGVSKNTIANWEKGSSCPNLVQSLLWFQTLGVNPHRPFLEICYPETFNNLEKEHNDEQLANAVHNYIENMPPKTLKQLAFIFFGKHGSSPISLMELFTAHLHTPMRDRINVAKSVSDSYEICIKTNTIVCPENIAPDIELLDQSINRAMQAVINGQKGYCTHN